METPSIPVPPRDTTEDIPSEVLIKILAFLTNKRDVSTARRISRRFSQAASDYVVTEIKFAYRLNTIKRFKAIINSPVFSQNVTTLYFDTSRYWEDLAMDQDFYSDLYQEADRFLDPHEEAVRQDALDLAELGCTAPVDADIEQESSGANGNRAVWLGRRETWSNDTHPKYLQRYRVQSALENDNIGLKLITQAFKNCAKLRNVIITDYRGMARRGESYAAACLRMFGRTYPPQRFWERLAMGDIVTVMNAMKAAQAANLDSFAIGPNSFASVKGMMSGLPHHALTEELLDDRANDPEEPLTETFVKPFANLRRLRLSYFDLVGDFYSGKMPENIWSMLTAARSSISHLSITRAGTKEIPPANCSNYPDESDFLTLTFPRLRSLELNHLQLETDAGLRAFLKRHASTLQELRLINCTQAKGKEAIDYAVSMAAWGRGNLRLTGIESVQSVDLDRLVHVEFGEDDEDRWRLIINPLAGIAIRHVERLEQCWIGNRENTLQRSVDVLDPAERAKDRIDWWIRPSNF